MNDSIGTLVPEGRAARDQRRQAGERDDGDAAGRVSPMRVGMRIPDLQDVVPWGRSFDEYRAMFALSAEDLQRRILDCGGGPSSFTAEAHALGCAVVACDPIYHYTARQIRQRVEEVYPVMVAGMEAERDRFVWTYAGSPGEHGERRLAAMRRFLQDFAAGLQVGRYVAAGVPSLPFPDESFELALSSHFLFLYADQLTLDFHLAAVAELLRVAREVRVFPLLDLRGELSAHLEPVVAALQRQGRAARVVDVAYEFQRGGNQVLVVHRRPA